ncbi:hypothetical protein [Halorientalis salina]|uniref:hypothetical protein n=1 Tax=Halorientalis salina TaxID=2932266 RepID=UPI0010AD9024|nr:hypothetical protein [Halorientalis salina]
MRRSAEDADSGSVGSKWTRRSLLGLGAIGILSGVVGLSQRGSPGTDSETTPDDPADQSSLVQEVEFDVQHLVVHLKDGHGLSRVNLIGPDGELFTRESVATGERTVRLQILDVDPLSGGYTHYTPGDHELVLIGEDIETETVSINLEPSLEITDAQQFHREKYDEDYGKLSVEISNTGTAPTWIYDISYQDSPNYAANDDLTSSPGLPYFVNKDPDESIITPGESRRFVGINPPLVFPENDQPTCDDRPVDMTVIVGTASEGILSQEISAQVTGESIKTGPFGRYVCTEAEIELVQK